MPIIKQILPGPLRKRTLGFYYLRCCFCVIFLSDLIYFIIIKHKWSQQWDLRKIVLSQDMFVFDLVNKQGFISLKRKKKSQILLNVTDIFCQVKTLSYLSTFAYQLFLPRMHCFPLCLSSFGAQLLWHFTYKPFQFSSDSWVQTIPPSPVLAHTFTYFNCNI